MFDRIRLAAQHLEAHVNALRGRVQCMTDQPVAAADLFEVDAAQIERTALARHGLRRLPALFLQRAHAHFVTAGRDHKSVAHRYRTIEYGAGNYGTAPRHRECAVDRIAKMARNLLTSIMCCSRARKYVAQSVDAFAGDCRCRKHGYRRKGGSVKQAAHVLDNVAHSVRADPIDLGHDHGALDYF